MAALTTLVLSASLFFGFLGGILGYSWWRQLHKDPRKKYLAFIEGAVTTALLIVVSSLPDRLDTLSTTLVYLSPAYLIGATLAYLGAYFTKQERN